MFDRIIQTPRVIEVNNTTHEHRAPTDDSIRLYHELREKAISDVVESGRIPFAADVTWKMFQAPEINGYVIRGVFCLNGKEHTLRIQIYTLRRPDPHEIRELIIARLREQLAEILTCDAMQARLCES